MRGIRPSDGGIHCYNAVGKSVFYPTSEQFGDRKLEYREDGSEQTKEIHFALDDRKERYEYLKNGLDKKHVAVQSKTELLQCYFYLPFPVH